MPAITLAYQQKLSIHIDKLSCGEFWWAVRSSSDANLVWLINIAFIYLLLCNKPFMMFHHELTKCCLSFNDGSFNNYDNVSYVH